MVSLLLCGFLTQAATGIPVVPPYAQTMAPVPKRKTFDAVECILSIGGFLLTDKEFSFTLVAA
jgi:hypothetical protein